MRWETDHPVLCFLQADPKFECVYRGQTAKVWRREPDNSLYMELACGHPHIVQAEDIGVLVMPVDQRSNEALHGAHDKEKMMGNIKAAKVPNSQGSIPVQGYEAEVSLLKVNTTFLKNLTGQVNDSKKTFRDLANQVLDDAEGDVKRVEFLSADGLATVPVTISDVTKDGNRSNIKDATVSKVARLGVALDELDVTETESRYTLTGEFVAWLEGILVDNYTSKGLEVPEDIKKTTTTRLTIEGVEKLRKMAAEGKTDNDRAAAKLLLSDGIKAAAVGVK